jgi:hypothetical protein
MQLCAVIWICFCIKYTHEHAGKDVSVDDINLGVNSFFITAVYTMRCIPSAPCAWPSCKVSMLYYAKYKRREWSLSKRNVHLYHPWICGRCNVLPDFTRCVNGLTALTNSLNPISTVCAIQRIVFTFTVSYSTYLTCMSVVEYGKIVYTLVIALPSYTKCVGHYHNNKCPEIRNIS